MKKAALGLLLLLLICGLLVSLRSTVYAEVKTWIVDLNGSGDFTNIQDGINAANSGDTVFVKAATYQENILLNTSISLIGEARETTIIDVRGIGNPLEITANGTIVSGFTFSYGDAGIVMTDSHNNLIKSNICRKNTRGIGGSLYTNTIIENNTVTENDYGIDFGHLMGPSSKNNTAKNNEIYSNTNAGIYVSASEGNNSIVKNKIHDNGFGIILDHTQQNEVYGNIATDNTYGIYMRSGIQDKIEVNLLQNNVVGIYLESSNGNNIFHNTFLDNVVQVLGTSYNTWDNGYPSGGNYWSDYSGSDANDDGIGDSPHIIDDDNTDKYPLMDEYGFPVEKFFNVTVDETDYGIVTVSNSTVSNLSFNPTLKELSLNVRGLSGTLGFCDITVPVEFMSGDFTLYLDDVLLVEGVDYAASSNATHYFFNVYFEHSIHVIKLVSTEVIPEFAGWLFLPFLLLATMSALILKKKIEKYLRSLTSLPPTTRATIKH